MRKPGILFSVLLATALVAPQMAEARGGFGGRMPRMNFGGGGMHAGGMHRFNAPTRRRACSHGFIRRNILRTGCSRGLTPDHIRPGIIPIHPCQVRTPVPGLTLLDPDRIRQDQGPAPCHLHPRHHRVRTGQVTGVRLPHGARRQLRPPSPSERLSPRFHRTASRSS